MIRPGEMRERVRVEQPTSTTNSLGEAVMSWSTFAERWAAINGVSAGEALEGGQQETRVTHRVRMRYLEGLTQQMRLIWRGRTLHIASLLEYANRSEHVMVCEEQVT